MARPCWGKRKERREREKERKKETKRNLRKGEITFLVASDISETQQTALMGQGKKMIGVWWVWGCRCRKEILALPKQLTTWSSLSPSSLPSRSLAAYQQTTEAQDLVGSAESRVQTGAKGIKVWHGHLPCTQHLGTKGRRIRHLRSYSAIAKGSHGQYNETKLKIYNIKEKEKEAP